jgi:hypothetical protein
MRKAFVTAAVLVVALAAAPPVGAISGGVLDGNAHPNVGVMNVEDANGESFSFCGGVLISPTVFLAEPTCAGAVAIAQSIGGRATISFDPVLDFEMGTWRTVVAGYAHPEANFNNGTNLYGIAVLAKPVRGITPAQLPTFQQLASVSKTQPLTVVGYGEEADCSGAGPCVHSVPDGARRAATAAIAAILSDTILIQNNASATGQGGVCGDGGAPYFLGDSNVVVAVADGATGCHSISWATRIDTDAARSFIDDFVSVP